MSIKLSITLTIKLLDYLSNELFHQEKITKANYDKMQIIVDVLRGVDI